MIYRISGNFQWIYISRISLVEAPFVKYKILKYFTSINRKIWSMVVIHEIKIREIENESPFVKYTTLENNHLHGTIIYQFHSWYCKSQELYNS